jgi:hypothetical protein
MILTCLATGYKHVNEARNILILNQENEILSQQQSVERYFKLRQMDIRECSLFMVGGGGGGAFFYDVSNSAKPPVIKLVAM